MKNRKQRIVAAIGFCFALLLGVAAARNLDSILDPEVEAVPPTISTCAPTQIPIAVATPSPETKINYSDTIQVLVTPELKQSIEYLVSTYEEEIVMATKVMVVEAGGVPAASHRAAVVWCILNRADDSEHKNIKRIITAPNQFAWVPSMSYTQEQYEFVRDIFARWLLEKEEIENVGRVLPTEYKWFTGNGKENSFRSQYADYGYYWDWSLPDPYI